MNRDLLFEIGFSVLGMVLAATLVQINAGLGQMKQRIAGMVKDAGDRLPPSLRPIADELMDIADLVYRRALENPGMQGKWSQAMRSAIIALSDTKLSQEEIGEGLTWVRSQFDPSLSLKKQAFSPSAERLADRVLSLKGE